MGDGLGKRPLPGHPTNLDYSRTRAYCACSWCGCGLFGHFSLVYHFSTFSLSLGESPLHTVFCIFFVSLMRFLLPVFLYQR